MRTKVCTLNILNQIEFIQLTEKYMEENKKNKLRIIYHVGVDAGFYSEICKMMECMVYCHKNNIQFVLFADDANFSNTGWTEFFETFCEIDHHKLNSYVNKRFKRNHKITRMLQYPLKVILKKQTNAKFLTDEIFDKYALNKKFREEIVNWDIFSMNGSIYYEFVKLKSIAMRYNSKTLKEIQECIKIISLPLQYISVQIRGGDKITEVQDLFSCEDAIYTIEKQTNQIENVFVFTDDYRNIVRLCKLRPSWKIYTLADQDDIGYNNGEFMKLPWDEKRKGLIKLFATVEICIMSDMHYGDYHASPNIMIRGMKKEGTYMDLEHRDV